MSLTFGPDGQPALAFQSNAQDLLFYRYVGSLDGPAWGGGTVVESAGNVGSYCSLAYGPDGQPAIAYGDDTGARLIKFARKGVFKPVP
jgi:hypothetical protein